MKSQKNLFIGVLLVLACATGALALYEYREILQLKNKIAADDADGLRKRITELEKQNRRLSGELAARPDQTADDAGPDGQAAADQRGGRGRGRIGFQQMLNNPQFQKLMAVQAKAQLDSRYAGLFKSLNLNPEQLDQLKNLMVQRQQAAMDAATAAMQEGLSPRSDPQAFRQALNDAEASVDQQIQAQLGSAAYAQYQQYQQTLPEHNTVNQLQQSLSYTSTPLSDDQANQLVQILQQASSQNGQDGGGGRGFGWFGGGGNNQTATVSSQAVAQAQGVLSAPQLQALQQIQQQQQAQQQMQQLFRAARQGASGGR